MAQQFTDKDLWAAAGAVRSRVLEDAAFVLRGTVVVGLGVAALVHVRSGGQSETPRVVGQLAEEATGEARNGRIDHPVVRTLLCGDGDPSVPASAEGGSRRP